VVSYPIHNYLHDPGWQKVLEPYWHNPDFQSLLKKLEVEAKTKPIYPAEYNRFRAFNVCKWDKCKVLILGQDPYHGPGQADGLSFSVPQGQKIPPSLRNIYKELKSDLNIDPAFGGDLSEWAQQGVLLLNSFLSVEEGKAGSHQKWGWELFTDAVIQSLSANKERMVFILWGNWAQKKQLFIDTQKHLIIKSAHPSPLSARHGFFGSKPFSLCNDFLLKQGLEAINWRLSW